MNGTAMVVIGLDLSITSSGMVVRREDEILGYCNPLTTPKTGCLEKRIALINDMLNCLRKEFDLQLAVVEQQAYSRGGKGQLCQLGELRGVIKHWLYRWEVPILEPPSNVVKLWATGFGDADKKLMLSMARRVWSGCPNHDLADAWHLAGWGAQKCAQKV